MSVVLNCFVYSVCMHEYRNRVIIHHPNLMFCQHAWMWWYLNVHTALCHIRWLMFLLFWATINSRNTHYYWDNCHLLLTDGNNWCSFNDTLVMTISHTPNWFAWFFCVVSLEVIFGYFQGFVWVNISKLVKKVSNQILRLV